MQASELPNRRVEAWKYSDLRAAFDGASPPLVGEGTIVERISAGAGNAQTRDIAAGEADNAIDYLDIGGLDARAEHVRVGAGATYHRIVVQTGAGTPLSFCRVHLAQGATFRQFVYSEGGRLARIETHVDVEGEGAHVELNGAYLVGAGRHADLTSVINHKAAGSEARQLIKGAARKGGTGVFQGRIVVEKGAQKTDARQYHHALLLEDGASVFAKPELMIYADDVQCAHGNTVGALDDNALFYARSRGVPELEARALLIEAFIAETLPDWAPPDVRSEISERISAWLGRGP